MIAFASPATCEEKGRSARGRKWEKVTTSPSQGVARKLWFRYIMYLQSSWSRSRGHLQYL